MGGSGVLPACYEVYVHNSSRIWQTGNILNEELPIIATQIVFIVALSRLLFFIYKPLHQPRLISQISVGFLLTPPLLGRFTPIFTFIFPARGVINIEVLAHIGVIYTAFLSGLEINLNTILNVKKKAATIAISGIIFPMVMGPALYTIHRKVYVNNDVFQIDESKMNAYVLWTLVLTVTGFPVVVHSLFELKLLYTGLDVLGTHSIVGAFVYGLILPHSKFADMVVSMTDDFGGAFLAPLFFGGNGQRLMVESIFNQQNWPLTVMVIVLLCVPKILSTLFATFFFGMPTRDGFALGVILNTKGVVALIMLNTAWDRSILSVPTYAVLTSGVLLMTIVVSPVINAIYKPRMRFEQNKLKTIQMLRLDAELGILACVHNTRQTTGIISLIESFNATRLSPIHVFALYLVELTRRAGALIAAHMEKPSSQPIEQNLTRSQEELECISNTFGSFGEAYDAVRVQTLNVVSAYATIHEDINNTANEKGTSLIILPFHKQLSSGGALETTNIAYKDINLNVMQSAPCSVGIFVDRGLGSLSKMNFCINMIFVGGPDDREALAVAWRMVGHPRIQLSVIRMLLFDEAAEVDTSSHVEAQRSILSVVMDNEKQKELDDAYVNSFRLTVVNNNDYVSYSEVDVHSSEDIPAVLKELEKVGCDLYIIGQGNHRNSRVFSNLSEWCDCLELGIIGDMLASDNFSPRSSMLVVQQYGYGGMVLGYKSNHVTTNSNNFEALVVKTE
ncbi:cation H(+) antiporter 15-like protein [Trifolium pratense]|uniref:Cation H(+) antiporter 15-like protein n=2 Tax=Trifolium pratense TaxID=57577 RepID=A0A2K3NZ41_TRIPR|nr:cation H(+) antiporter 15-like protein [Trifolium pratense]PNY13813.1 cation H(+) antiporter 15-like protein [Trifolium pratense]